MLLFKGDKEDHREKTMGYIKAALEPGEEIIYRITPARHFLRLSALVVMGVIFSLLALSVPVLLALGTQRLGRFPVIWGLPDSLPVLVISVGIWLTPFLAMFILSLETAQIFACELVVTDRRVMGRIPSIFIFRQLELAISDLALVSQMGGRILFKLKNNQLIAVSGFQNIGQFVEVCRMRMIIAISVTTVSNRTDDPNQRLKRLKEALDTGLINEMEYTNKKNEILKQM
jgi:hypothetical protein